MSCRRPEDPKGQGRRCTSSRPLTGNVDNVPPRRVWNPRPRTFPGLEQLQGDLFDIWLEVAHCRPPGRQRDGLQIDANLDLRRLAEAGPRERCDLALRWWTAEEEYLRSDMSCW